ncbi:MAG: T9SS type A sorting domain-containing protein [Candidatus Cloacimonetes bacterium]|nr:T9SS type A sorting domain-containing protein [Candidatus Cloacimonadota bacterium]
MKKIILLYLLVILPIFLSAQWYVDGTVGQTGNGSQQSPFKTIAEAVAVLHDGDIVHVAPATYTETVDFDDHYFDLIGDNVSTTIIDGDESSDGIIIPDGNPAITGLSTIKSLTVMNCYTSQQSDGAGIAIKNRNVVIDDCIIQYNESDRHGGGIFFAGDDDYILTITNCKINNNSTDDCGGGIYFYGSGSDELVIQDCDIYSNTCEEFGGGVFASGTSINLMTLSFENSDIYGNVSTSNDPDTSKGGGIYAAYLDYSTLSFENLLVYENSSYDHGSGIIISNSDGVQNDPLTLNKLTVVDNICDDNNPGIYFESCSHTLVTNSIIWNESGTIQVSQNSVEYCCIYNDYAGTGNLDDDPEFVNAASDDYSIEDYSPCIDMGDPDSDYDDSDDSRADMGYEYVDQDKFTYVGEVGPTVKLWKWLSYPRLPVADGTNNGDEVSSSLLRHHWNPMPTQCGWYYEEDDPNYPILLGDYDDPEWDWFPPTPPTFNSTKGYKVYRKGGSVSNHFSPGLKCLDGQDITISTGENWIGYFLEDSQQPSDAFPSAVLDDLNWVQGQSWTWARDGHGNWLTDTYTINYGDCIIVSATAGHTFDWETPSRSEPVIRPEPEHYAYLEEIDYQPIYVDFGENELPLEVAVYVDDICRGAEVVDGQVTQICAYILECDPGLQVEFEFYYDNRQIGDRIRNYDIETAFGVESNSNLETGRPGDIYFVSFRDLDFEVLEPPVALHCYPNPFNPELTISFNIDETQAVKLEIYNSKGQKVKTMVNELFRPADYSLVWNGTDDNNRSVSSGVYFIKLQVGDEVVSDKVILMK